MRHTMSLYHLAQYNVARCHGPLDTPIMRGFVDQLEAMNLLADRSPGFVWRFQTPEGNATSVKLYDDPLTISNLSVWKGPDALKAYVYRSSHVEVYRARKDWFGEWDGPNYVLWWIPSGTLPTMEEGRRRVELLALQGPTSEAFSFRALYSPPDYK